MSDISGRWFSFEAGMETVVCLERNGLPDHLKQLPNLETPMLLSALLVDLEDSGEVSSLHGHTLYSCHAIKPKHVPTSVLMNIIAYPRLILHLIFFSGS